MNEIMEDHLKVADEVLADIKRNGYDWHGKCGEYAIVEVDGDGIVHLVNTCTLRDEYYTIETYGHNGWYIRAKDLTNENFWDVWSTWNGYVCGSIALEDYDYAYDVDSAEWTTRVREFKTVTVADLKRLPAGTYTIYQ